MSCHHEAGEDDYHGHGHGHDHDHDHGDEADTGPSDSLFGKVLDEQAWCLNEAEAGSIRRVFKPWHRRLDTTELVTSDVDGELLIYVPFNGMVKLKSIFVWGGAGGSAPQRLRVFANRDDLDFDSIEGAECTQEWDLARGAREPVEYAVRAARFGAVRCLTLLVPRCFDAPDAPTELLFLAFRGDWMPLRADPVISIYELTPNAADHKAPATELMGHRSVT
ncbi:hypothetical protein GGI04_002634 [Coemansia thaxteri]|nr:hypothetical protein GGI04_002634 [Coemansia thaxteri]KAJ2322676.1 hypothetical protein GGH92_011075 [Coemansia sp. RSA 2673]KAJ2472181.1 hypothetical protein GGI02_001761 [Coemansia sp. RSA 2322]KAJ2485228.1 hypothetical protein EV174_001864 [Coemansia sp. RSA 2320]